MSDDPVETNPDLYRLVMENQRVRVLEYHDRPGDRTKPHRHPDSVMVTLSAFRRRLVGGNTTREVAMEAGTTSWLPAQEHAGENIGDTDTHVIFVELKEPAAAAEGPFPEIGPQAENVCRNCLQHAFDADYREYRQLLAYDPRRAAC